MISKLAPILTLILLVDCSQRRQNNGEQCNLHSDCLAPLTCQSGACRVQCGNHRDCPSSYFCVPFSTENPINYCWQPPRCSRPRDCTQYGPEYICVNGFCLYECEADENCIDRGTCDLARHVCTGSPDGGHDANDEAKDDASPPEAESDAPDDAAEEPPDDITEPDAGTEMDGGVASDAEVSDISPIDL